jgi:hypothetical protein
MIRIFALIIVYKQILSLSYTRMHENGRESHVPIGDKESGIICCANHSIAIGLQGEGGRGRGEGK